MTCRSWDDFLAVSAQRWGELRDHLTTGRLGAALARAGFAEQIPDPDSRSSPDERLDDWLGSLPTTKQAVPELEIQPNRIDLEAIDAPSRVGLRIANIGYRLLRFRVQIEPPDATWLILPPSADGLEMVTVEGATLDLTVMPARKGNRARSATLRIESNGGDRAIPVSVRPAMSAAVPADRRLAPNRSGPLLGGFLGFAGQPLASLLDRVLPSGMPLGSSWLVLGTLGLGVGAWIVGRKAGLFDRIAGASAGLIGGLLAADVAIMAAEGMPSTPWWISSIAWAALGALSATATGLSVPSFRGASR